MAQQRRVKPAVGVAAVGLGIGAGALGLYQGAVADPPRPVAFVAAPADKLLAEGRELIRQNKLAAALGKADAAAKLGATTAAEALRRDTIADGKQQIEELTAQAKVLAGRGDGVRAKASLDLARQVATEIGQPTAPPDLPTTIQPVVFRPADAPPAVTPPPISLPPASVPTLPPAALPASLPAVLFPPASAKPIKLPPVAAPVAESEKPLLPGVPALNNVPSGLTVPPAVPVAGGESPAPGATPVKLPKLATVAAAGMAFTAAPLPAQDAAPKPGPGSTEVARPLPVAPAPTPVPARDQLDGLKADILELKDYKRQVQDLLQGKADGGTSVLDAGVLKRLTDLERKLESLEKSIDAMKLTLGRLEAAGTTALKPAAPAAKTAVRLVNDYPSELSLILNGSSHRLKPGETKLVDVPPGSFTYELIAEGATPITRTIRAEETVTLRIK